MRGDFPPSCHNHGNNNCTVQKMQKTHNRFKNTSLYTHLM